MEIFVGLGLAITVGVFVFKWRSAVAEAVKFKGLYNAAVGTLKLTLERNADYEKIINVQEEELQRMHRELLDQADADHLADYINGLRETRNGSGGGSN